MRPHTAPRFFFFNDTATTEIYTLSLHDALPILPRSCRSSSAILNPSLVSANACSRGAASGMSDRRRSEEHTSELQSQSNLVCRLLLEKKKHSLPAVVSTSCLTSSSCTPTEGSTY